jgi:hypothetical protein
MSPAARSMAVFGIYLALAGLTFTFAPNAVLPLLGFAPANEIWIRFAGLLTGILALYFLYSARHEDRHFFRVSVYGRLIFLSGMLLFVLLGWGSAVLIVFGLVDLAGAAWTWTSLRAAA